MWQGIPKNLMKGTPKIRNMRKTQLELKTEMSRNHS